MINANLPNHQFELRWLIKKLKGKKFNKIIMYFILITFNKNFIY